MYRDRNKPLPLQCKWIMLRTETAVSSLVCTLGLEVRSAALLTAGSLCQDTVIQAYRRLKSSRPTWRN
ncbi:hypothetical protein TBK1r_42590 [Stieleria magnilauensis]|uniref:Uncharacterized protein n=1 Tax=Stieleria magnilauensis TaxID=2527963 RepID=A0ABX5XV47_9BACT|nr:hypothetical protein TBK1r_42590 [Planctomycetes bacterium TBK1r]